MVCVVRAQFFPFWKRPGGRLLPYFCSEKTPRGRYFGIVFWNAPGGVFSVLYGIFLYCGTKSWQAAAINYKRSPWCPPYQQGISENSIKASIPPTPTTAVHSIMLIEVPLHTALLYIAALPPPPSPRNKSFELLRSTATTVDFQKIKLQEIDDDNSEAGRIPRTVEVELHEDLVDTCIPGVCLCFVCVCVCVCVCVFIKLHITAQFGPVILVILCHSH